MDSGTASDPGLTSSIPQTGIDEVLRGWSGEGSIYDSLAVVSGPDALDWTAGDIRRRARRVLLALIDPVTAMWPATAREWEEHLPSSSNSEPTASRTPTGSVNWRETRRLHGWPPQRFVGRLRRRVVDEVTINALAWLSHEVRAVVEDVRSRSPGAADAVGLRLDVVDEVLTPWGAVEAARPDRLDLLSLRSSGYPWTSIASAGEFMVRADQDPEFIAFDLIAPDPEIGWRLFHLASYGMVIRALRNHGFLVTWRRPLSGHRPGAQIEAIAPSGNRYDLWFEAGSARGVYGRPGSAYHDAVRAMQGVGGPIGVDIMLIQPGQRALLMECKWSTNVQYVGRYGFHQASSYALDALGGLAPTVWSFVVGPQTVVPETSVSTALRDELQVVLGSTAPHLIGDVVAAFLADEPTDLE